MNEIITCLPVYSSCDSVLNTFMNTLLNSH